MQHADVYFLRLPPCCQMVSPLLRGELNSLAVRLPLRWLSPRLAVNSQSHLLPQVLVESYASPPSWWHYASLITKADSSSYHTKPGQQTSSNSRTTQGD